MVSEDGMGSGCNLPAKLTRLLGSGYGKRAEGPGPSKAAPLRGQAWKDHTPWLFQLIPQQPPVLRVPFQHGCLRPLRFCSTDLWLLLLLSCNTPPPLLFSSKHIFHIKTIFSLGFFPYAVWQSQHCMIFLPLNDFS